jgi:hypothetical protein
MTSFYKAFLLTVIITFTLHFISCKKSFERTGVVVDRNSNVPLENVSIEIYLKNQVKDSLKTRVITDQKGYFLVNEKRPSDQLFILEKGGYISYVSSLKKPGDTIRMEKIPK